MAIDPIVTGYATSSSSSRKVPRVTSNIHDCRLRNNVMLKARVPIEKFEVEQGIPISPEIVDIFINIRTSLCWYRFPVRGWRAF